MAFQRMRKHGQKPSDKRREQNVAKDMGGTRVSGSGNTPWAKEDIKTDTYLVQHKWTEGKSISVTKKSLFELRDNAIDAEKEPLYILDYNGVRYYILQEYQFNEFNRTIQNLP